MTAVTAADEAAVTAAVAEPGVDLARDMVALLRHVADMIDTIAEWGDYMIAGGEPERPVAYQMIHEAKLLAAAARGEPVAL
jgi:hypothetical protein